MPGHNSSLFVLGVMILWFGWYGFNPGSQQLITGGNSMAVATAAIATTLAAAAGGISALITRAIVSKVTTGARTPCLLCHYPPTCLAPLAAQAGMMFLQPCYLPALLGRVWARAMCMQACGAQLLCWQVHG